MVDNAKHAQRVAPSVRLQSIPVRNVAVTTSRMKKDLVVSRKVCPAALSLE